MSSYEIRYSEYEITSSSWNSAKIVAGPSPSAPGSEERLLIEELESDTIYYFAMKIDRH